jgi:hypothetical protein
MSDTGTFPPPAAAKGSAIKIDHEAITKGHDDEVGESGYSPVYFEAVGGGLIALQGDWHAAFFQNDDKIFTIKYNNDKFKLKYEASVLRDAQDKEIIIQERSFTRVHVESGGTKADFKFDGTGTACIHYCKTGGMCDFPYLKLGCKQ